MDPQHLEEALSAFTSARVARSWAVNKVSQATVVADDKSALIRVELDELTLEIEREQRAHDLMQKHADQRSDKLDERSADAQHSRSEQGMSRSELANLKKLRSNIDRRNRHGRRAKQLRRERDLLVEQLEDLKEAAKIAERQYDLRNLNERFYSARHLYLLAISLSDADDENAFARKQRYMELARLTGQYEPQEVWYYEYIWNNETVVHLFYGGQLAPMGGENSPDGYGHGHTVLGITETGDHVVKNARPALV